MELHKWYRQTFQDGDCIWFRGDSYQKNGHMTGILVAEYPAQPRKHARAKRSSVALPSHASTAHMWKQPIAELDVPQKVRSAYTDFVTR